MHGHLLLHDLIDFTMDYAWIILGDDPVGRRKPSLFAELLVVRVDILQVQKIIVHSQAEGNQRT
jgi:hypothetical protein